MWRTTEGSTGRLIQLCIGYFVFYVITGITVKYFLGPASLGFPGMKGMEFLVYSTLGGTSICLFVVLAFRWYRLQSNHLITVAGMTFPVECLYIVPSGILTAVVIPTTTLMYTLPISVMVAMVIMRASVIVVSRIVDAIQIRQGILKKKIYWQENVAVGFALVAASVHIFWARGKGFDFVNNGVAVTIFCSYIVAYALRIYIMNYYRNTRGEGVKYDNKGFFAVEQISASTTLLLVTLFVVASPGLLGWNFSQVELFNSAIFDPLPQWEWAALAGTAFGFAAFFSVFLFIFKGRTATFSGLVNRLTSLIAGTAATVIFWLVFNPMKAPKTRDWISLAIILIAVGFLTAAERKRAKELTASREIEEVREPVRRRLGKLIPQQA